MLNGSTDTQILNSTDTAAAAARLPVSASDQPRPCLCHRGDVQFAAVSAQSPRHRSPLSSHSGSSDGRCGSDSSNTPLYLASRHLPSHRPAGALTSTVPCRSSTSGIPSTAGWPHRASGAFTSTIPCHGASNGIPSTAGWPLYTSQPPAVYTTTGDRDPCCRYAGSTSHPAFYTTAGALGSSRPATTTVTTGDPGYQRTTGSTSQPAINTTGGRDPPCRQVGMSPIYTTVGDPCYERTDSVSTQPAVYYSTPADACCPCMGSPSRPVCSGEAGTSLSRSAVHASSGDACRRRDAMSPGRPARVSTAPQHRQLGVSTPTPARMSSHIPVAPCSCAQWVAAGTGGGGGGGGGHPRGPVGMSRIASAAARMSSHIGGAAVAACGHVQSAAAVPRGAGAAAVAAESRAGRTSAAVTSSSSSQDTVEIQLECSLPRRRRHSDPAHDQPRRRQGPAGGHAVDRTTDERSGSRQPRHRRTGMCSSRFSSVLTRPACMIWWRLGSRVVSVLDLGAEGPGFKSQPRCCRVTVLGKLFTPIVPLFTKQRNWYRPS